MASFDLPEIPQSRVSPALMLGVASPLWSYFGAVAVGGMAYWWMTQWARPANLEARFNVMMALPAPSLEPMVEAVETAVEAAAEVQAKVVDAVLETPAPAAEPEVVFAAAPEPVIDEPTPVWAEAAAAEAAPKSRAKKAAAIPTPEADA